ncbi:hypothetical protein PPERSA_11221 [Pseudocohnilembus persalinus]|uniref:Uncharacterized protein n=1 Tax=Pseudocohnilembus persalinus TaxID=266149 RepID=A0A0V0R0I9_PSEPJ|nr:hypothetical protein PPERSA_11221 [Pseudocohnilembus persalinus]|eukprot:KRX07672.1 hypothetical protein PPERSA_11221 [Pseudocohnilembus persalinus]
MINTGASYVGYNQTLKPLQNNDPLNFPQNTQKYYLTQPYQEQRKYGLKSLGNLTRDQENIKISDDRLEFNGQAEKIKKLFKELPLENKQIKSHESHHYKTELAHNIWKVKYKNIDEKIIKNNTIENVQNALRIIYSYFSEEQKKEGNFLKFQPFLQEIIPLMN